MLRRAKGLRQMYDKTRFRKNCTTKLPQKQRLYLPWKFTADSHNRL